MKAAWRLIPNDAAGQAFKTRCFWVPTWLYLNGEKRSADMGLVGLHLVSRTPKRPQWIWSSFEHVDNVPNGAKPESGRTYSFNYGASPDGTVPGFPNADPDPKLSEKRTPVALAEKHNHGEGTAKLIPMQVVARNRFMKGRRRAIGSINRRMESPKQSGRIISWSSPNIPRGRTTTPPISPAEHFRLAGESTPISRVVPVAKSAESP